MPIRHAATLITPPMITPIDTPFRCRFLSLLPLLLFAFSLSLSFDAFDCR
jgi:hypothetical protein